MRTVFWVRRRITLSRVNGDEYLIRLARGREICARIGEAAQIRSIGLAGALSGAAGKYSHACR